MDVSGCLQGYHSCGGHPYGAYLVFNMFALGPVLLNLWQWFLSRGNFPPRKHVAMSGNIFSVRTGREKVILASTA